MVMLRSRERKLIVKHTFFEIEEEATDRRKRSATDGSITYQPPQPITSHGVDPDSQLITSEEKIPHHVKDASQGEIHCEPTSQEQNCIQEGVESDRPLSQARLAQENANLSHENSQLRALIEGRREAAATSSAVAPAPTSEEQYGTWATAPEALMLVPLPSNWCPAAAWQTLPFTSNSLAMPGAQTPSEALPLLLKDHAEQSSETLNLSEHISLGNASIDKSTTIFLRNLPNQYTRDMLLELLCSEGFGGKFDFAYLPVDFKTHSGLGYALVDLTSPQEAERAHRHFNGFCLWAGKSEKICTVSWSRPDQQGLAAHVERYRNSPVMHESVHDAWKPAMFSAGVRAPFPRPTKRIRAPRIRVL